MPTKRGPDNEPRTGYRKQGALFLALTASQIRHIVAIQLVLRVIAERHPQLMDEALRVTKSPLL